MMIQKQGKKPKKNVKNSLLENTVPSQNLEPNKFACYFPTIALLTSPLEQT